MLLTKLCAGQQWRHRHKEQTYGHGEMEEGKRGMYGKSNTGTYITICKIDSQWEFAVSLRELKSGLYNNLEWWDGEGGLRKIQEGGDICISMADSC